MANIGKFVVDEGNGVGNVRNFVGKSGNETGGGVGNPGDGRNVRDVGNRAIPNSLNGGLGAKIE